jgi:hypothetical protein
MFRTELCHFTYALKKEAAYMHQSKEDMLRKGSFVV